MILHGKTFSVALRGDVERLFARLPAMSTSAGTVFDTRRGVEQFGSSLGS